MIEFGREICGALTSAWVALAAVAMSGCAITPDYKDTLSALKAPAVKAGPLAG